MSAVTTEELISEKGGKALRKTVKILLAVTFFTSIAIGQERSTGSIKGKVRVESGTTASGVTVIARQDGREVKSVVTDRKGEFVIAGLAPGLYTLTFRKPGLSVGTIEKVEVRAGKVRTLNDRLYLPVDEGSIAFVRGSVFNMDGRSIPGARVEIALIAADGTVKKLDGRITNEVGSFSFRLTPDAARYRVTAKADGMEAASRDVEVEGAAIYRVALSLQPATK